MANADAASVNEGGSVDIAVKANDTDADGDALTVTAVTQGARGSVAINGDGTVKYTPNTNYIGSDSFTYTISDGKGRTATGTVSVTVNGGRRIALGLNQGGGNLEIRSNALANYNHLSWLQVNWPWYNGTTLYGTKGDTRVAVGDLDGNGSDEVVVGLGPGSGGTIEIFHDARWSTPYAHWAWLRVPYYYYDNINGETNVAVGDLNGDGKAEIVVGLGRGGYGYFFIFGNATTGFAPLRYLQVPWPAYNYYNGETRPAVGDLDGDGKAEIVVGLGPIGYKPGPIIPYVGVPAPVGGQGYVAVFDDWNQGNAFIKWFRMSTSNGETRPAVGDLDGDGKAEIVVGRGPGGGGWMLVLDDLTTGNAFMKWLQVPWAGYNRSSSGGETWPAVGDTDGDGKAEIVAGLGVNTGGRQVVFDDASTNYAFRKWLQIPWSAYNGSSKPAIGRLSP